MDNNRAVINAVSTLACYGDHHLYYEAASLVLIQGACGLNKVVWC